MRRVKQRINKVPTIDVFDISDGERFSDKFATLYNNEELSDVKLVVGEVEIPAHKTILAASSPYFKALFYGQMRESRENRVQFSDTPIEAFEILLKYIYSGKMQIPVKQIQLSLGIIELADKYDFPEVKNKISGFLKQNITVNRACEILNIASMCSLDDLKSACMCFIDINTTKSIKKENFLNISFNTLCEILGRESLSAEEIDIVKATLNWIHANKPEAPKIFEIFKHIRLSLIPAAEYNSLLAELTAYVTPDNLVEFINEQKKAHNSRAQYHRGVVATENVATVEKGAKVLEGIHFPNSLPAESKPLFNEKIDFNQYIYQHIGKPLTIQLGRPYFIESFGFVLLCNPMDRCYSFYIEVSKDHNTWEKIGQYEKLKGWQVVRFGGQIIQYIRFVGSYASDPDEQYFDLMHFECPAQQKTIEEAAKNV